VVEWCKLGVCTYCVGDGFDFIVGIFWVCLDVDIACDVRDDGELEFDHLPIIFSFHFHVLPKSKLLTAISTASSVSGISSNVELSSLAFDNES
jgi:hypothetical protein